MTSRKLNLQNATSWEVLPDVWKVVKKVKPIDFYSGLKKDGIKDKGLFKVVEKYLSDDALRPNMQGANYDGKTISCTNAHVLISIPADLDIDKGNYMISPKIAKNSGVSLYSKIDAKFPDVKRILNVAEHLYKVEVYKLKTYIQAVINGKYCSRHFPAMQFKVNNEMNIGFNGELLTDVLDSFLLLGHTELYFGFGYSNTRALIISPNQATAKDPENNIGKFPFALVMPLMLQTGLGATDLDFATEITAYFSFADNEIINGDGSVAKFDINLSNTELPYMSADGFSLIKKLIPKNGGIPITEYVKVQNTIATITDLEFFLEVKDVFVDDGFYEVCNGALKDTKDFNLDDFPVVKDDEDNKVQILEINTNDFAERTKQATLYVGDDDLRPVTMTMLLQAEKDKGVNLVSTNAHILFFSKITDCQVYENQSNICIKNPKNLSEVLSVVNDDKVKLFGIKTWAKDIQRILIETDNYNYYSRLEDAKFPDYKSVISNSLDSYISFNTTEMISILNSFKGEDAKKGVYFDFKNIGETSKFEILLGEIKYGEAELKNTGIQVPYTFGKSNRQFTDNMALIMPIYAQNIDFTGFNNKFLKNILVCADKDEVRLHFKSSDMRTHQFVTELRPVTEKRTEYDAIKKIAKVEIVKEKPEEKKATKEEVMIKIKALKLLADMGNKEAENKIKILKLLL